MVGGLGANTQLTLPGILHEAHARPPITEQVYSLLWRYGDDKWS